MFTASGICPSLNSAGVLISSTTASGFSFEDFGCFYGFHISELKLLIGDTWILAI
jgi:hypothetical protein